MISALGSGSTGGGTATLVFNDPSGTTARITATITATRQPCLVVEMILKEKKLNPKK